MTFYADLHRLGITVSGDGVRVTLTEAVVPAFFGRPARRPFSLTVTVRDLHRLRRQLTDPDEDTLHLPVTGHVVTEQGQPWPTSRLIATGTPSVPRLRLAASRWCTSGDRTAAWLEQAVVEDVEAVDAAHFTRVHALWAAGLRPLHRVPRCLAAGLTVEETLALHAGGRSDADVEAAVETLAVLRADPPVNLADAGRPPVDGQGRPRWRPGRLCGRHTAACPGARPFRLSVPGTVLRMR